MTVEQQIYEAKKIIEWLVDGYFTNYILQSNGPSKHITAEWIVEHYNVEMVYFRPHLKQKK